MQQFAVRITDLKFNQHSMVFSKELGKHEFLLLPHYDLIESVQNYKFTCCIIRVSDWSFAVRGKHGCVLQNMVLRTIFGSKRE
jgi:hypothetical protein